jgi:hypothetical protein
MVWERRRAAAPQVTRPCSIGWRNAPALLPCCLRVASDLAPELDRAILPPRSFRCDQTRGISQDNGEFGSRMYIGSSRGEKIYNLGRHGALPTKVELP